ncbi:hypothetical protein HS088_TW01G00523 [Tripterygium wilfordii]|uniref:Uncharacterized protein n=2 Tax=Tripterygium wilfordii TaxID=458696 RepID=A0A7J7E1X4_TRIWF|nr:hypothetical protein HS088_TW01G00523 [Tripterygium wilfordii]
MPDLTFNISQVIKETPPGHNPEIRIVEDEHHLLSNKKQHKRTRESDMQNQLHKKIHIIPETEYAAQNTNK